MVGILVAGVPVGALLEQKSQRVQKQVQQIDDGAGVVEQLVVLLDLQGDFVGTAADILFVDFGVGGEGTEENFGHLQMKELLLNFGVHENLIRNIAFQKPFVDASLEPVLGEELINKAEGDDILALELLPGADAALVVVLETEVGQVLNDGYEDVLGVVLLELRGRLLGLELVAKFLSFPQRVRLPALGGVALMHLGEQLGFNKQLVAPPSAQLNLPIIKSYSRSGRSPPRPCLHRQYQYKPIIYAIKCLIYKHVSGLVQLLTPYDSIPARLPRSTRPAAAPPNPAMLYNISIIMIKESPDPQKQCTGIVEQVCRDCLEYLAEHVPLSRSNFPLLEITYTLWRRNSYHQLQATLAAHNQALTAQHIQQFHAISEKKYLPMFVERVRAQMNIYCRGLKTIQADLKEQTQDPAILEEEDFYLQVVTLGEHVWRQQLYLELIEDLIRLPYLEIINEKTEVRPKPEYQTEYVLKKRSAGAIKKMADTAGKSILNKLIKVLTETVFSKTFALKINTLLGSFNPVVLGASFGLTQYLQQLDKKNKEGKLRDQVCSASEFAAAKVTQLQQTYEKCLLYIDQAVNQTEKVAEDKKNKLKKLYLSVFEYDEIQFEVIEEQDGWEQVNLHHRQSFQELQFL